MLPVKSFFEFEKQQLLVFFLISLVLEIFCLNMQIEKCDGVERYI